jgi:hypothetical protein
MERLENCSKLKKTKEMRHETCQLNGTCDPGLDLLRVVVETTDETPMDSEDEMVTSININVLIFMVT